MNHRLDTEHTLMLLDDGSLKIFRNKLAGPIGRKEARERGYTDVIALMASSAAKLRSLLGPGWISVDDRLPENHQDVIAWWPERRPTVTIARYYEPGDDCPKHWFDLITGENSTIAERIVTHWMPLPPAPQPPIP